MWLIAGTVPDDGFELYTGGVAEPCQVENNFIILPDKRRLSVARGTTALLATAILASQALNVEPPRILLAGDQGTGKGSFTAYDWLAENLASLAVTGLTFHYFYPDVDAHNKLYMILESLIPKPVLVADAGFMYAAKMSGLASGYDLFTPDIGELAFLADEKSPHPFYTRGFLLAEENNIKPLLARAMRYGNCPDNMIIKGQTDYIVCDRRIIAEVTEPLEESMECIGGTGDIVTGFATAYLAAGCPICQSALRAARAARCLGAFCQPNPATQAATLIAKIKPMMKKYEDIIEKPAPASQQASGAG